MNKTLLSLLFMATFSHGAEVLMQKGDVTLTDDEIYAAISDLSDFQVEAIRQRPENLKKFIENIFDNKYMAASVVDKIEKDNRYEMIKSMSLNQFNINYYLKTRAKEKLAEVKDFKVAAKQEYETNLDEYKTPALMDFYHILFIKYDNPIKGQDAKKLAASVLADIKSGKTTIAEASKKYRNAVNGTNEEGIIPNTDPKRLTKELGEAVKGLKAGEMTDVVEDRSGYHILGVKAIHEGGVQPYNPMLEKKIIDSLKEKTYKMTVQNTRAEFQGAEGLTFDKAKLDALFEAVTGVKVKPAEAPTLENSTPEKTQTEEKASAEASK